MAEWTQATSTSTGGDAEPTPGVHQAGVTDLETASAMLSDARTGCVVPHHPSLGDYCPECNGTMARRGRLAEQRAEQQERRHAAQDKLAAKKARIAAAYAEKYGSNAMPAYRPDLLDSEPEMIADEPGADRL